jgi:hypothetical protein
LVAEPHAIDRVRGAPLVEPLIVAENQPHTAGDTALGQSATVHREDLLASQPGSAPGNARH